MRSYIFKASDLAQRDRAYSFDDVLLVPLKSAVKSRFHVELDSAFTKNYFLKLPFVASNMDTISEGPMCAAMNKIGAAGVLHRFMTISQQVDHLRHVQDQ